MNLLDSDGPCYDPDLYASLGDDARKAAREDAVTEAYEGKTEDDRLQRAYDGAPGWEFDHLKPCTCTLACQPAVELVDEDMYCHEQRSCEKDVPGAFGPGYVFNPAVFGRR